MPGWDLEPEPSLHGGRLTVLAGVPYSRTLHEQLLSSNKAQGNMPLDMLMCVPAESVVRRVDGTRQAGIAENLQSWGLEVWDATSIAVRSSFPVSLQQHRIVQYESCRGLEGWSVVCLGLDQLFERKRKQTVPVSRQMLPLDDRSAADAQARRWVMIPLTRAIDSLIIQLECTQGDLAEALGNAHQRYPELIDWIE